MTLTERRTHDVRPALIGFALRPEPTPAQLEEISRWLHDESDTRTPCQLRAALRTLGSRP